MPPRLHLLVASLAALGLQACAHRPVTLPDEPKLVLLPMAPREACKDELKPDEKPTCSAPGGGTAALLPCGPEPIVVARGTFVRVDGGLLPCKPALSFAPPKPMNSSPAVILLGK